jgi:putative heme-binding domain-containing protein
MPHSRLLNVRWAVASGFALFVCCANASDNVPRYEQYALTHEGDAEAGRTLFLDAIRTRCAVCHKVSGEGGEAGPDLSAIGGKLDRPHLVASLLAPSQQIVEGYRTSIITDKDGRTFSGVVKEQTDEDVTLYDADGKTRKIPTAAIETREESPVSLMPDKLYEALAPEEFTHLVAYLETLRTGGKPTPGSETHGAISLREGFEIRAVATGLTGATALETLPDGRVLLCEQTGALRVIKDGKLLARPFVAIPVEAYWERGLIGVTIDPDFPATPYVYLCYVSGDPYPHHRVSRFTADGDVAVPGSEKVLLTGDDQRTLGGNVPAGHQGGAVHFGPDGCLYVAIGEQTAETPSQSLSSFQGKILRIHADGTIPTDNPFNDEAEDKYRAIWALGLRNPFTFAFRPGTREMFINDVGGKFEEINIGRAGGNFGWPVADHGPTKDDRFIGPIHIYPQASINGGDFAPESSAWPAEYRGKYFFADFVHGWIKTLDPEDHERVETFVTGLNRPVDLRFSPDGSLYVLLRNAWVIDDKFQPATGTLLQIRNSN